MKMVLEIYRGNFIEAIHLLKSSMKAKNISYALSILKAFQFHQHNSKLPRELFKLIQAYIIRYLDIFDNKQFSWIFLKYYENHKTEKEDHYNLITEKSGALLAQLLKGHPLARRKLKKLKNILKPTKEDASMVSTFEGKGKEEEG